MLRHIAGKDFYFSPGFEERFHEPVLWIVLAGESPVVAEALSPALKQGGTIIYSGGRSDEVAELLHEGHHLMITAHDAEEAVRIASLIPAIRNVVITSLDAKVNEEEILAVLDNLT